MSNAVVALLLAAVVVVSAAGAWAVQFTRRPHGVARSLAAKGTSPSQIARQLRLAEDVVGLLAATATPSAKTRPTLQ